MRDLLARYPQLSKIENEIQASLNVIIDCYQNGGKMLLCGNGGSAADCEHMVGELMKGFLSKRPINKEKRTLMKNNFPIEEELLDKLQDGLPAISLPSLVAINSAVCNDIDAGLIYAQQLVALGKSGDVLVAISTSGNSKNVIEAVKVAKALGIMVIGLTGNGGGKLKELSNVCICAPESETYKIQELHLPIYHYLCAAVEKHFFK